MQDIQSLFDTIQSAKREQKEIRKEYRDALLHESAHQELTDQIKDLREKKKLLESEVQAHMGSRWDRLEELKHDIAETQEMISDAAISLFMKGEPVAIKDEYDTLYEPKFSVTFKKADGVVDGN
jgi:hypothetical protein